MNKADAALLRRVQARIRLLRPELADALLVSLERVRDLLTERELNQFLSGRLGFNSLLSDAILLRAFAPYRAAIRKGVESAVRLSIPDLPMLRSQQVTVGILFDTLDPVIIEALRTLETSALSTLAENTREVVRAFVENGIRDGRSAASIARELRTAVGIAPHQERFVQNYERELRSLSSRALGRELTDARYDSAVRKAIASGTPLTEAQITERVTIYRKRFAAHNTEVVTRQTTLDAYRTGNRMAWQGAIDNGFIDGDALYRTWVHADGVRDPRPDHVARDGETVRFDEPYSDGTMTAGIGAFNCRCTDRYSTRRNAKGRR